MSRGARGALLVLAVGAGLAVAVRASPPAWSWARGLARVLAGLPATWRRAALPAEEPAFSHLAASQLGYGPAMRKRFTSPVPFAAFQVVEERTGALALRGAGPVAEVETDLLGATRRVFVGDLTALAAPGRYRVVLDGGLASHPFAIGADVFDAAARAVQRTFYFQRAFTAVEARHAEGPWVHASDEHLAPPGEGGGWHDAGDHSLYSASTVSALFWLLSTWADFGPAGEDANLPESGNGLPDLLDEAAWGLRWLLSVQEPQGGFRNTTCQERYGPYGTNRPEAMGRYRSGEVGTIATGRAVGTLAFAAAVFRPLRPALAERYLAAARAGMAWLEARPAEASDGPTCPAFRQDGDLRALREVRMYAAAGLLLATGEPRFRDEFDAAYQELENDPSYHRSNVYAALLYLRAPAGDRARKTALQARLRLLAGEARADGSRHPFEWAGRYLWGSVAAGLQRAAGLSVPVCLADPERHAADCDQALEAVHYALGRNLPQRSYLSGLGARPRLRAFHHWYAALQAEPFLPPGYVAGGPMEAPLPEDRSAPHARPLPVWGYWGDPALPRGPTTPLEARWTDNDSWSTNEVDVEWQAVALYALHFARSRAHPAAAPGPGPRLPSPW